LNASAVARNGIARPPRVDRAAVELHPVGHLFDRDAPEPDYAPFGVQMDLRLFVEQAADLGQVGAGVPGQLLARYGSSLREQTVERERELLLPTVQGRPGGDEPVGEVSGVDVGCHSTVLRLWLGQVPVSRCTPPAAELMPSESVGWTWIARRASA
jgi:hypothetical protein